MDGNHDSNVSSSRMLRTQEPGHDAIIRGNDVNRSGDNFGAQGMRTFFNYFGLFSDRTGSPGVAHFLFRRLGPDRATYQATPDPTSIFSLTAPPSNSASSRS